MPLAVSFAESENAPNGMVNSGVCRRSAPVLHLAPSNLEIGKQSIIIWAAAVIETASSWLLLFYFVRRCRFPCGNSISIPFPHTSQVLVFYCFSKGEGAGESEHRKAFSITFPANILTNPPWIRGAGSSENVFLWSWACPNNINRASLNNNDCGRRRARRPKEKTDHKTAKAVISKS